MSFLSHYVAFPLYLFFGVFFRLAYTSFWTGEAACSCTHTCCGCFHPTLLTLPTPLRVSAGLGLPSLGISTAWMVIRASEALRPRCLVRALAQHGRNFSFITRLPGPARPRCGSCRPVLPCSVPKTVGDLMFHSAAPPSPETSGDTESTL